MHSPRSPFAKAVDSAIKGSHTDAARNNWVKDWLNPGLAHPRFAVGRNAESLALNKHVPLSGILDDRHAGQVWEGIPLVSFKEAPPDAWVMNCATSIAPVDVELALARQPFERVLRLSDCLAQPNCPTALLPNFVSDQHQELSRHMPAWEALYKRLADDASRQVLLDVCRFRLTADPSYMNSYSVRLAEQYFEPFLQFHEDVFVDAGAFDGDTTELFCMHAPTYRRVYLIEPSARNMAAARKRLANHSDIVFIQTGLSDQAGELAFDPDAGSASAVSGEGRERILVDTLDTLIPEPATFIKMDLEGWELKALAGSANHIRQHKPALAIAVYHQASHFREVLDFVLNLHPDYKVRLGHYTQGWSETVMYFTEE